MYLYGQLHRGRHGVDAKMDDQVMATVDELLGRLESMEEMEDLRQLDVLIEERTRLLRSMELCDRALQQTQKFFLEVTKMILLFQTATDAAGKKQAMANRTWLEYWGIEEEESMYEMEQLSRKESQEFALET
jgi:hypothetical protein